MRQFLRGAWEQLRQIFASRLGLALLLLFVTMSITTGAIYERLVLRDVAVVVVDRDGSRLSRLITTSLDATPELAIITEPSSSVESARSKLERGDVAGYLLIPNDFSENIKHGKKTQLVLATDMSNVLVGKTVRSACSKVVATINAGVEIGVLRKLGSSRQTANAEAVPIVVEDNQMFNPATNYAEYLTPIIIYFLLHIYATVLFAGCFLDRPFRRGIAHQLGQLSAVWLFCSTLALVTARLLPASQVSVASPVWLLGVVFAAYAIAQLAFISMLMELTPSPRFAFQVILFVSMLGLMLSGATWPTYAFPRILAQASELLPFTHLVRLLRTSVHFEAVLGDCWVGLMILAKLTAVFGAVAILAGTASRLFARAGKGEPSDHVSL
ncbi:MAG TPA: ABC transporter permease [Polyangiaceae bacterium]|nr:ABC transporter permease [Polyangiaceae bacterium]